MSLAAAVVSDAQAVVTFNLKDFPLEACQSFATVTSREECAFPKTGGGPRRERQSRRRSGRVAFSGHVRRATRDRVQRA